MKKEEKDNQKKKELVVKTNLSTAGLKERKAILNTLGTQLWCLIRGVNYQQKETLIETLLFNGEGNK